MLGLMLCSVIRAATLKKLQGKAVIRSVGEALQTETMLKTDDFGQF